MAKRKFLSDNDVEKILGLISARYHSARNRCLFLLGLRLGMTAKELAALTISDVVEGKSVRSKIYLDSKKTKGKNGKTFVLDEDVKSEIKDYLVSKYTHENFDLLPADKPLFTSQKNPNRAFTPNGMCQTLNEILTQAGYKDVSSGSLKRSYITNVLSIDDEKILTTYSQNNDILEAKLNGWLQSIGRLDVRVKLEVIK